MSSDYHKNTNSFSALEKHLLNDFQHNFPLCSSPFSEIAKQLGVEQEDIIDTFTELQSRGVISRIGPVFKPNSVGASLLAALAVPEENLVDIAMLVNSYEEVNHNYEREHEFNLWFVVTAHDEQGVQSTLDRIESETNLPLLRLPLLEEFHIDLGFELQWT